MIGGEKMENYKVYCHLFPNGKKYIDLLVVLCGKNNCTK